MFAFQLLEDLVEQQNKLENDILRIQQDRETERIKLIEQIQDGKQNIVLNSYATSIYLFT